jgi:hypothetical protein
MVEIRVLTVPGNCRVFIDNRAMPPPPFTTSIAAGRHQFRFEWEGTRKTASLTIRDDRTMVRAGIDWDPVLSRY